MTDVLDIAILGAGAMGSLFGGLLAEAGHRVTLVDIDEAHLNAIRAEGLRLSTDSGSRIVGNLRACRPEQAGPAPELLIIFTKTMHTEAALASGRHLLGPDTAVLSLQNGLGNVERIGRHVPHERIMVGMTTWPADKSAPGQVSSHGAGVIHMMSADGKPHGHLRRALEALNSAGLNSIADPDVWPAIWEKVAFNAAMNSLCALTRCAVGELANVPDGEALALKVVAEAAAVAGAEGIAFDEARVAGAVRFALVHHQAHKPSMLQDVLAGRKTEIEAINGAIAAAARKTGTAAPTIECLLQLVRLVDARGPS